ncbi:MAG: AAA family ATPase [Bacteroidales bacterium]|nr:AAA family ATPase [Bacteroidales bacterium]
MIEGSLLQYMQEQLDLTSLDFKRYLYNQMDWNKRLQCLTGGRGVGKSTMVKQHIIETPDEYSLYVSADHSYFTTHTLIELADDFVKEGGEHLYIDEIHKYEGWSREIKQIYDTHPALKVFITGSSILDLLDGEADLSRRIVMKHLYGMSFREYLALVHKIHVQVYSLEDVLAGKAQLKELPHPLPLFRQYLRDGYYPFAMEGDFFERMQNVIRQTMESDIPHYAKMSPATGRKLRQMLSIVAQSAPYKPEAQSLANELHISRNDVPKYLLYMEEAEMIGQLRDDTGGMRGLGKVEKVLLGNTNIQYTLVGEKADIGNVRETFFYNQLHVTHDVIASRVSDFSVGDYTFEIGGRKKGKKQISDVPNGYVVRDEIEYATQQIIPLWMFGLLY